MARLRFQKFEKELSPVEQGVGIPSYPAAPPPQQMVGDEVLSESRAYERLGQSILDFGSTLGKVITNEQGRIRKEVWEQGMPLALAELDRELEQRIIDDYQQGLSPAESKKQWKLHVKTLIDNIKSTKSWKSITHEGDRNKLETILRDRAHSMEIRALQQSYALQNELQSSMVQNQITGALNDQLLEIQDPSFNKNSEGEGLGHTIPQDIFLKSHVIGRANAEIEQILEANNISGRQAQRLKLWAASAVNDLQYKALSHHIKIKTGIAAANWQEKYNNLVKTAALGGSSVRRRLVDGKVSEDSRLDLVEEHLQGGLAAGLIGPKDALRLREDAKVIFDLNDVNNDIRDNPLDTYWMLRTDEPTKEEKEEIIADSGKEEWNRLNELRGGYYPSLMGAARESKIKNALSEIESQQSADMEMANQMLKRAGEVLIDPESSPESIAAVKNTEFLDQFKHYKHFQRKPWKLKQWKLALEYAETVGLGIKDIDKKSYKEFQELKDSLHPKNQKFKDAEGKDIPDQENFRYSQMIGIYSGVLGELQKVIDLRVKDPASIGHQQAVKDEIDPESPEGIKRIIRDQMNWKGIPDDQYPSPSELSRQVLAGTTAVWSLSMRERRGKEWNALTISGTGVKKKEFLDTLIKKSGENASSVMNEFIKADGFTWGDYIYTEISNPVLLDEFNDSQKHLAKNREEVGIIFDVKKEPAASSFKTLREKVSRDETVRAFLDSFGTGTAESSSVLDMLTDYVIYKKTKNRGFTLDEVIELAETHLISNQYVVIQGGSGERTTVRIALNNLPQRNGEPVNPDVLNDVLIEYTERLVGHVSAEARETGWNIADIGGSDLWQWRINPDESGLTLFFWNEDAGMFQEALYKKAEFPLTWSDLQGVYDIVKKNETSVLFRKRPWNIPQGLAEPKPLTKTGWPKVEEPSPSLFREKPWFKKEGTPVEPEVIEPSPEPEVVEPSPKLSMDEQIKQLKDIFPEMTNQQVRQAIRAAQR